MEIVIRTSLATYHCPTSLKLGINYEPPCAVKNSDQAEVNSAACMLLNTNRMVEKFAVMSYKFDLMYAKRAFVHWFVGHGKAQHIKFKIVISSSIIEKIMTLFERYGGR